jgi:hypothetical protein
MNRVRRHGWGRPRQWLGLCLVLLLAVAPPFNLAGFELSVLEHDEAGAHAGPGHHGHDHSNLAHHSSANGCLQCLVMGGMSLAGAAALPDPAPVARAIANGWVLADFARDLREAGTLACRGPPAALTA